MPTGRYVAVTDYIVVLERLASSRSEPVTFGSTSSFEPSWGELRHRESSTGHVRKIAFVRAVWSPLGGGVHEQTIRPLCRDVP